MYNTKEELNDNYVEDLDIYIGNPYYQIVFNEYHELWVGGDIYKYVGNNILATAPNNDITSILDMRTNDGIFRNGVTIFDEVRQEEINRPAPPCFFLLEKVDHGVNNGLLYIGIRVIGPDNNGIPFCGGLLTIDWGDGTIEGPIQSLAGVKSHQYNIPMGSCITPTISVSFIPNSCGACSSFEMSQDISITVCGENATQCIEGEKILLLWEDFMSDSDGEYRALGIAGYNTQRKFWKKPHVWSRLITYKKKNNGKWKRKSLNNMAVIMGGSVRSKTCTGSELFNGLRKEQTSTKSSISLKLKYDEDNIVGRTEEERYMLTRYEVHAPQQNASAEDPELITPNLRIFK